MKKAAVLLAVFMLFSVFGIFAAPMTSAATTNGKVVIAVDLAHGENPKGLTAVTYKGKLINKGMIESLTNYTFVYFGSPKYQDQLGITRLGDEITYDALKKNNVTILIIGQPTNPFRNEEILAIKQWLLEGGHVLWIAGDSDYGSNGVKTQQFVNVILDKLNMTNLRVDLCEVADPVSNAGGKSYRVVAYDDPWKDTPKRDVLVAGLKNGGKVLVHGPGPVAWVDSPDGQGNWHALNESSKPKDAYVIIHSSNHAEIGESNPPAANAYQAGQTGTFPILAAQIVQIKGKNPDVIIVSGETPIGGYEPMWAAEYYGVKLDGPQVVTNILTWSLDMTKKSSGGGICGPAFIIALAALPLVLRKRK